MKFVVLDGYTLNPGDLDWRPLQALGDVKIYDRTPAENIIERAVGAAILLTNKTPVSAETIRQLPSLKYIGVLATGYNVINTEAAKQRGIVVSNVPGYGTASVVQMTFALLLELCQNAKKHSDAVREGRWTAAADWCFWDHPLIELSGKTMGIIGFGHIGQNVAGVAAAFGMNVIATSRRKTERGHRKNVAWKELNELLAQADVVSLHCPLTKETQGIINKKTLSSMKPSAFLLNTSRGPLINEQDLADALNADKIAGAGLDVLSTEPPPGNNPLLQAKNCLITPHIAWATKEARSRLLETVVDNVKAFLAGHPQNVAAP